MSGYPVIGIHSTIHHSPIMPFCLSDSGGAIELKVVFYESIGPRCRYSAKTGGKSGAATGITALESEKLSKSAFRS